MVFHPPSQGARRPVDRHLLVMNVESPVAAGKGGFPSPLPTRGRVLRRSPRPRMSLRLPRSLPSRAAAPVGSVSLKNETGDPSRSRISALAGVVMPAGLEGPSIGIGGKVRPCAPLVDHFWS